MTEPTPAANEPREQFVSLRLRLWTACVAGGAVAGAGTLWVLGTRVPPQGAEPSVLLGWLTAVAFAAVVAGLLFALWLDHHIVGHLRGLLRGVHTGRVAELRGLPGAAGWGELSELSDALQAQLTRQRQGSRAEGDREKLQAQLVLLKTAIDGWSQREVWEAPPIESGLVAELADALGAAFARRDHVDGTNREAAQQVSGLLGEALGDAQESAEQAERGFVEATALLTTVRELQRLSGELQNALSTVGAATPASGQDVRTAARDALEDLVGASSESVNAIGRGLLRVQDVGDQVQQLANRATLIAIHVVTAGRVNGGDAVADELKQLAKEVREATDHTTRYTLDIETAVAEANERMRASRERALARLEQLPATATSAAGGARAYDDAQRLLERVREMVQDAARKGERLSAAGERASRAAERLARRIDEGGADAEALVVRMTPVGTQPAAPATPALLPGLRLLPEEPAAEPASHEGHDQEERS